MFSLDIYLYICVFMIHVIMSSESWRSKYVLSFWYPNVPQISAHWQILNFACWIAVFFEWFNHSYQFLRVEKCGPRSEPLFYPRRGNGLNLACLLQDTPKKYVSWLFPCSVVCNVHCLPAAGNQPDPVVIFLEAVASKHRQCLGKILLLNLISKSLELSVNYIHHSRAVAYIT